MRHGIQKVRSVFALAAVCAAGAALVAAPAHAVTTRAEAHGRTTVQSLVENTAAKSGRSFKVTLTKAAPAGSMAAADIITCGGTLSDPYRIATQVRVDSTVSCDGIVDTIRLTLGIGVNGVLVNTSDRTVGPANFLNLSVETGCLGSNTYRGAGIVTFTKAGYVNSPLTMTAQSQVVPIAC